MCCVCVCVCVCVMVLLCCGDVGIALMPRESEGGASWQVQQGDTERLPPNFKKVCDLSIQNTHHTHTPVASG
jgi:hypothetical protein